MLQVRIKTVGNGRKTHELFSTFTFEADCKSYKKWVTQEGEKKAAKGDHPNKGKH
jgi:hypothetical protein